MKTLTKYMTAYNEQSNTIELLSFDKPIDESEINESFGSFLKGVFGSYFKVVGAMSNAAAEVLDPKEKKNFEKAQKDIMASDDTKKALDEKDPDKVVEYINKKYDEFKEEAKLTDETVAKFKIVAAMQFHAQHKDDKAYTAKMSAYIDELKKKSEEVKKFAEDYAKELNDNKTGENNEVVPPTKDEINNTNKSVDKTSKALGGDDNQIKQALSGIINLDASKATEKESLENDIFPIVEADQKNPVKQVKSLFLNNLKSSKIKDEDRENNRQAIIQFATSISAMFKNMKDNYGKPATDGKNKKILIEFIKYAVNNYEVNGENFMKILADSK